LGGLHSTAAWPPGCEATWGPLAASASDALGDTLGAAEGPRWGVIKKASCSQAPATRHALRIATCQRRRRATGRGAETAPQTLAQVLSRPRPGRSGMKSEITRDQMMMAGANVCPCAPAGPRGHAATTRLGARDYPGAHAATTRALAARRVLAKKRVPADATGCRRLAGSRRPRRCPWEACAARLPRQTAAAAAARTPAASRSCLHQQGAARRLRVPQPCATAFVGGCSRPAKVLGCSTCGTGRVGLTTVEPHKTPIGV
jgi:hypothetical protein